MKWLQSPPPASFLAYGRATLLLMPALSLSGAASRPPGLLHLPPEVDPATGPGAVHEAAGSSARPRSSCRSDGATAGPPPEPPLDPPPDCAARPSAWASSRSERAPGALRQRRALRRPCAVGRDGRHDLGVIRQRLGRDRRRARGPSRRSVILPATALPSAVTLNARLRAGSIHGAGEPHGDRPAPRSTLVVSCARTEPDDGRCRGRPDLQGGRADRRGRRRHGRRRPRGGTSCPA